jgi:putative endonuclease
MFYVYVLKSQKDGKLYTGQTSNLEKRISEHNSCISESTKSRVPFQLEYYEEYETRSGVMKREKTLKSGKGREYLDKILKRNSNTKSKNKL